MTPLRPKGFGGQADDRVLKTDDRSKRAHFGIRVFRGLGTLFNLLLGFLSKDGVDFTTNKIKIHVT
jgi:hypothetical protein